MNEKVDSYISKHLGKRDSEEFKKYNKYINSNLSYADLLKKIKEDYDLKYSYEANNYLYQMLENCYNILERNKSRSSHKSLVNCINYYEAHLSNLQRSSLVVDSVNGFFYPKDYSEKYIGEVKKNI